MLNLHAPFRWAVPDDFTRAHDWAAGLVPVADGPAVVAEEDGQITAILTGAIQGETLRVTALATAPRSQEELIPRILAVADAIAADEGLAAVVLDPSPFGAEMLAILDQKGFRPADEKGQPQLLSRPVVPQG
jgi:hypothetical protein